MNPKTKAQIANLATHTLYRSAFLQEHFTSGEDANRWQMRFHTRVYDLMYSVPEGPTAEHLAELCNEARQ